MSIPLVMTGPGGGYVTQYMARGRKMKKTVAQSQEHPSDSDTETGSTMAGYTRMERAKDRESDNSRSDQGWPKQNSDTWEPTRESGLAVNFRGRADQGDQAIRRWVASGAMVAAAEAIGAWLKQQNRALSSAAIDVRRLAELIGSMRQTAGPMLKLAPVDMGQAEVRLDEKARPGAGSETDNHDAIHATEGKTIREAQSYEPDTQTTRDTAAYPRLASDARLFPDDAGVGRRTKRKQSNRVRARRSAYQKGRIATEPEQGSLFGGYRKLSATG